MYLQSILNPKRSTKAVRLFILRLSETLLVMPYFFSILFLLLVSPIFAQTDWQTLQMGSSAKKWQGKLTDISNPNSLDETAFVLNEEIDFYGIKAQKAKLGFYNDRLFTIRFVFAADKWNELKEILTSKIDSQGKVYEDKKEGYWYKDKAQFAVFTSDNETTLYYTDESQKDFHWRDLFQGTMFYVFITIIGLVVSWFVLVWLWTSYCPKCRSLTMEHIRRDTRTTTINTGTFTEQILGGGNVEMRFRHTDIYRCKKCGYETKYKSKKQEN